MKNKAVDSLNPSQKKSDLFYNWYLQIMRTLAFFVIPLKALPILIYLCHWISNRSPVFLNTRRVRILWISLDRVLSAKDSRLIDCPTEMRVSVFSSINFSARGLLVYVRYYIQTEAELYLSTFRTNMHEMQTELSLRDGWLANGIRWYCRWNVYSPTPNKIWRTWINR